jgi:predicted transcriptional regulator
MSKELSVGASSLYRVVRRLVADGVVTKEGRALRMA